jgi:hypothetical protein
MVYLRQRLFPAADAAAAASVAAAAHSLANSKKKF